MTAVAGRLFRRIGTAWDRYHEDDGPLMAAAVAYYLGLSLFPLLLILIAGTGWFLRFTTVGQSAEEQLLHAMSEHLSPALVLEVTKTLTLVQDRSQLNGPIGLLGLLATALAAFAQFERAFDRIWGVPLPPVESWKQSARRLLIERGTAFLMLLVIGFFLLLVAISGVALAALRTATAEYLEIPELLWRATQLALTLVLNFLLLLNIYRWLPQRKPGWLAAAEGAALAVILWEAGRHLLARFLIGTSYGSAYGVVGSFIAILLWCYYAVTVIFVGAEFVRTGLNNAETISPPAGGTR